MFKEHTGTIQTLPTWTRFWYWVTNAPKKVVVTSINSWKFTILCSSCISVDVHVVLCALISCFHGHMQHEKLWYEILLKLMTLHFYIILYTLNNIFENSSFIKKVETIQFTTHITNYMWITRLFALTPTAPDITVLPENSTLLNMVWRFICFNFFPWNTQINCTHYSQTQITSTAMRVPPAETRLTVYR